MVYFFTDFSVNIFFWEGLQPWDYIEVEVYTLAEVMDAKIVWPT